jgi:hypothetical protein
MPKWTKESALKELDNLISEIEPLSEVRCGSAPHTRWSIRTFKFLSEVFGDNSLYSMTIAKTNWGYIRSLTLRGLDTLEPEIAIERKQQEVYRYQLDKTKGVLQAVADELTQADSLESIYEGKILPPKPARLSKS